jgi:DNA helicase HerA-like ATPase
VGVYFVTQNPLDIPDSVLGQLGNRVQHALRAFTPRDQKAVKAAAETMRPNPKFSAEQAIGELAVGEALVSLLDAQGTPCVTERALIVPPASRVGPLTDAERAAVVAGSPVAGVYDNAVDRESAYEKLKARVEAPSPPSSGPWSYDQPRTAQRPQQPAPASSGSVASEILFGRRGPRGGRQSQGLIDAMAKSAVRSMGSQAGRSLMRGLLGSLLGGRR